MRCGPEPWCPESLAPNLKRFGAIRFGIPLRGRAPGDSGTRTWFATVGSMFVDVHSHVVPSRDDGAQSIAEGIELCRLAADSGTRLLVATPHVTAQLPLDDEREEAVRAAHAETAAAAGGFGLELELGFELTAHPALLDDDPTRYRMGSIPAVLVELPFHGSIALAVEMLEQVEQAGLVPVVGHPERSAVVRADLSLAQRLAERSWLLQLNATSITGYHGPESQAAAWKLLGRGLVSLVASDGHRHARPPRVDAAYARVKARFGGAADRLFDGSALEASVRKCPTGRPVDVRESATQAL